MMKRILYALITPLCFLSVRSQTTINLSGKVSDTLSRPIESATVEVLNSNFGAVSDKNGHFTIKNVPSGNYTVHISAIGFAALDKEIKVSGANVSPIEIRLEDATRQLDAILVTAQKKDEALQNIPFSISALSSRKVEQYRIWNTKDITAIVPNLYSANPGDDRNVTSIRGITSTSYDPAVSTYVNGINQ